MPFGAFFTILDSQPQPSLPSRSADRGIRSTGVDQLFRPGLFIPAETAPKLLSVNADVLTDCSSRVFTVEGGLNPGVPLAAANGKVAALAHSLARSFPATDVDYGAVVKTELQARKEMAYHVSRRTREIGIRMAVGAANNKSCVFF